ncbi:hypothetical protein XTPLMG728_0785 [Xanthomonas translucens pv. poae]|uniref:Uncharacterized protein n=1 Tax=Xanthomonas graminis pv. poae TaxID=227946 RepID=A0A0K2ZP12_9XANT|nr:hypothetical protein XTPLMG728_0785 [Xanthomonas translucens pv. poae]
MRPGRCNVSFLTRHLVDESRSDRAWTCPCDKGGVGLEYLNLSAQFQAVHKLSPSNSHAMH